MSQASQALTTMRGHEGEMFVADALRERLAPHGIHVWVAAQHGDNTAAFDILAGPLADEAGGEASFVPVVGIENKDLSVTRSVRPDRFGTRITRKQKRRKLAFVDESGLKLAITSISVRHTNQVGWLVGIVNASAACFDYSTDALADAILAACGGALR